MSVKSSPFHIGERRVQERLGLGETVEGYARRAIRSTLSDQQQHFFSQLPFLVVAAYDQRKRPWATLLTGPPGFIRSTSNTLLDICAKPFPGDAIQHAFFTGSEMALLGIELQTKRRNRANGTVMGYENGVVQFGVKQSFGNCPRYISSRSWRREKPDKNRPLAYQTSQLSSSMIEWIKEADTFFIASGFEGGPEDIQKSGLDVSHRGGDPGFVEVEGATRLLFPDYAGNNYFNTLGNIVMDPKVGLLFVDFEQGSLLQITGHAQIDWDSAEVRQRVGAQRLVSVDIKDVVVMQGILPLRWGTLDKA